MPYIIPLLSLGIIADELVGVESGSTLVDHLDELLTRLDAVPARLYLFNADEGVFFSAAGFGCPKDAPDLAPPGPDGLQPGFFPLLSAGEWVGILHLGHITPRNEQALRQLCILLAPILVAVHRHQELVDDLTAARDEISKIISAGELLRHLDLDVLLVKILEAALDAVRAEVGAIITIDEGKPPRTRVTMGLREDHVQAMRLKDGRTVAEAVLGSGQTLVLDAAQVRNDLDLGALAGRLTGLLALPLTTRGQGQGVVILANPATAFDAKQRRLAETVCSLAAIALDNALLVKATVDKERLSRELQLARTIQAQMSPERGLTVGDLAVEGMSKPCDETGGDYYTFGARGEGAVGLIADVTGHGLGAALFTTMAHALIQQQIHAGAPLDKAFMVCNEGLMHAQTGRFMTAAAVEVAGDGAFTYVSAGHNPLLWIHQGAVHWLGSGTVPLGIMPIAHVPLVAAGRLEPGDLLVLYTDGFTEAPNDQREEFGEDRLEAVVLRAWHEGLPPDRLMAEVDAAVEAWTGGAPRQDDLTMVVFARRR